MDFYRLRMMMMMIYLYRKSSTSNSSASFAIIWRLLYPPRWLRNALLFSIRSSKFFALFKATCLLDSLSWTARSLLYYQLFIYLLWYLGRYLYIMTAHWSRPLVGTLFWCVFCVLVVFIPCFILLFIWFEIKSLTIYLMLRWDWSDKSTVNMFFLELI